MLNVFILYLFNIVLLSTVHAMLIILYVLYDYFLSCSLYTVIISLCLFVFLTWGCHLRAIALYSMCIYTYIYMHACTHTYIYMHAYIHMHT